MVDVQAVEAVEAKTPAPAWRRWQQPAPRATYFWSMLGAGAAVGIVGSPLFLEPYSTLVFQYGWAIIAFLALLIGSWMAQRPASLLTGFLVGYLALACGWVGTLAVYWLFPHRPDV